MDVATLMDRAIQMCQSSGGRVRVEENPGVSIRSGSGIIMNAGRDKLTFIISPPISSFGLWVEQLIQRAPQRTASVSIGLREPLVDAKSYGNDRVFVYLKLNNGADAAQDAAFEALKKDGMPTVQITLADKLDLGEEFMRWKLQRRPLAR